MNYNSVYGPAWIDPFVRFGQFCRVVARWARPIFVWRGTGGGVGAGVNGVTRGQQVQIHSETLVTFRLQSPILVSTTRTAGGGQQTDENQPQLERRANR